MYVKKKVPRKALEKMMPNEAFWERKASVSCFKISGCDAYAQVQKSTQKKFNARSKEVMLLGYDLRSKTY